MKGKHTLTISDGFTQDATFTGPVQSGQRTSVFDQDMQQQSQQKQQQQTDDNKQQNNNTDDNTNDNTSDISKLWQNDDTQQQQQQQQQQTGDNDVAKLQQQAREHLQKVLSNQDFLPKDADMKALSEQLGSGDLTGLTDLMQNSIRNAMGNTMLMMGQIMDQRIEKAVETAVSRAGGQMQTDKAVTRLQSEFELANDEVAGPLVLKTFGQAMKKHRGNIDAAIDTTKKAFTQIGKSMGFDTDGDNNRNKKRGNGLDLPTEENQSGQPDNWVDFLQQS